MQTDWGPAASGGASFQTYRLVSVDSGRMEFRPSVGAILFYLLFLVAGLAVLAVFCLPKLSSDGLAFDTATLVPLLVGVVFTSVGGYLLYTGLAPIVFDKTKGAFWKGRKDPEDVIDPNVLDSYTRLDKIHALQFLSEHINSDNASYLSFELNLVLEDGQRINVVDHGNQHNIRQDTKALSDFLKKPVWEATWLDSND